MGKGGCSTDSLTTRTPFKTMNDSPSFSSSKLAPNITNTRPWYRRGGMHVNEIGMAINISIPVVILVTTSNLSTTMKWYFLTLVVTNIILAFAIHKMRGVFCGVVVPIYLSSSLLLLTLRRIHPLLAISLILFISIFKVGVCMSVCLHRYAAHAAFKCSAMTRFFLNVVGCAANQGGPIWWASQHRCHHKFCDIPRDPHSTIVSGVEKAFSFFQEFSSVNEEFVPRHMDSVALRVLDTWSFSVLTMEMMVAYMVFGREGLFICYSSAWICQTITLWFNIANHPEDEKEDCKASDTKAKPQSYYPAFIILDALYPMFAYVVGEDSHKKHHLYSTLAKRSNVDIAYYVGIVPLEMLGLVWDVRRLDKY